MTERKPEARALAHLLGVFHNITYYAPELKAFAEVGLAEYWRAYIAYRSAPMGMVPPSVVTSTFYNFAPRVIAKAVPSAWETISPSEAIDLRDDGVDRALRRALDAFIETPELEEAADLAWEGIDGADVVGRPLFAAHTACPLPSEPHRRLWHACTLWREHRGDGHNIALAAAGIDGLECHVLLGAKGVVNPAVIEKIRGWTAAEWAEAHRRLADRGLIDDDGFTPEGRALRDAIELQTDELASEPRNRLGADRTGRLIELMEPLVAHLISSGSVAGTWPPKRGRVPRS